MLYLHIPKIFVQYFIETYRFLSINRYIGLVFFSLAQMELHFSFFSLAQNKLHISKIPNYELLIVYDKLSISLLIPHGFGRMDM